MPSACSSHTHPSSFRYCARWLSSVICCSFLASVTTSILFGGNFSLFGFKFLFMPFFLFTTLCLPISKDLCNSYPRVRVHLLTSQREKGEVVPLSVFPMFQVRMKLFAALRRNASVKAYEYRTEETMKFKSLFST